MADNPQADQNNETTNDLYNQLAGIEPPRDIPKDDEESESEDKDGRKTFTERVAEHPNLSDMQAFDKRLFPDLGKRHLNGIMISRVFPDNYNPLGAILVKDLLRDDEELTVGEAIAYVHVAESVAIDGEGRIDELALAGVVHQENIVKDQNNKLLGV